MSRKIRTLKSLSAIHDTKGFGNLPVSVQEWLRTLKPVELGGVVAWQHQREEILPHYLNDWTPPQVEFALNLFRPERAELVEQLEGNYFDEEEILETAAPSLWRQVMSGQRDWKPAKVLFGWSFAIDSDWAPIGFVHTWNAVQLSSDLALLTYHHDDEEIEAFPNALGVIYRPQSVPSAALLVQGDDPNLFRTAICDELSAWGLPDEEVYRLFLARTGRHLEKVLLLTREELRKFSPGWALNGFRRISKKLHQYDPGGIASRDDQASV